MYYVRSKNPKIICYILNKIQQILLIMIRYHPQLNVKSNAILVQLNYANKKLKKLLCWSFFILFASY